MFCFLKLLDPAEPPQVVYLPTTSWGDTGWSRPGDQQVGFYKERRTNLVDLRVVVCGKRKLLLKLFELERLLTNLRKKKEPIVLEMEKVTYLLNWFLEPFQRLPVVIVGKFSKYWLDRSTRIQEKITWFPRRQTQGLVGQDFRSPEFEKSCIFLCLWPTWVMFRMFSFSVATSLESSSWNLPNSTDLFAFLVSVEEERESNEVLIVESIPLSSPDRGIE